MKKTIDVARAWRDEDYFMSLTEEDRATLGMHPSGAMDITDDTLKTITGGCGCTTVSFCSTVACTPCPGLSCGA